MAIDEEAIYFTDPHGAPVVTRVSKCDGTAQALAGLTDDGGATAMRLAVAAGNVAWIGAIGVGGEIVTASTQPGGVARLLASTSQPLSNSIGLDDERVYFADGAIESVPLLGGAPTSLASMWAGIAAVDAANVYFDESPPTGTVLGSIPRSGGPATNLVPSVSDLNDFAQDASSIYWLQWNDQGSDSVVMAVSKSGGAASVLVSGQDSPHEIAVDETNVYWTIGNRVGSVPAIVRAPKAGGAAEPFAAGPVIAIAVDARTVYWSTGDTLMKLDK
jgi:hypothetical protein